jgi:hypothetical protein
MIFQTRGNINLKPKDFAKRLLNLPKLLANGDHDKMPKVW